MPETTVARDYRIQAEREVAELPPVALEGLELPLPPCSFCIWVTVEVDADGFTCPGCGTRWSLDAAHQPYACTRWCVQCSSPAEVTDADGQPRCRRCAELIRSGSLDPLGPYDCRDCGVRVVGIGAGQQALTEQRCGSCLIRAEAGTDG